MSIKAAQFAILGIAAFALTGLLTWPIRALAIRIGAGFFALMGIMLYFKAQHIDLIDIYSIVAMWLGLFLWFCRIPLREYINFPQLNHNRIRVVK
jgi:hypothetical protein